MNKKVSLIFLFLPLVIVCYLFVSNLYISLVAPEVKFKTVAYDPYDIIRGRYLNVQLDLQNELIIPEIQGLVTDDESYEKHFITTYKSLTNDDKQRFEYVVSELISLSELYELNDTDWSMYRDNSHYIYFEDELTSFNEKLDDDYRLKELLEKIKLCNEQGINFFEMISNIDFKEEDSNVVRSYFNNLENNPLYVYYEIGDDGYANITKISYEKEKDNKNYIKENSWIAAYNDEWIKVTRISPTSKEFFIDERLAAKAEDAISDARNDGKEVVVICRNMNGNMQIKELQIEGINLYDYLENY